MGVDSRSRKRSAASRRRSPPDGGAIDCASTVTHARPPATASACGLPPTWIVAVGLLVLGLILVTVPSPLLATHTDPAPNATPAGDRPTGIVAVTDLVPGSIRTTVSSSESTTQTPPAPTVIAVGALPTGIGVGKPGASTRTTLSASVSVSHTAPSPIAIPAGLAFGSSCRVILPIRASRRVSRPVDGATHTESPCAAIVPGPPGTTLPIVHRGRRVSRTRGPCDSTRRCWSGVASASGSSSTRPPIRRRRLLRCPWAELRPGSCAASQSRGIDPRDRLIVEVGHPQRP